VSDQRMLRCSDHDRERVAETLRVAAGDGRLTLTELEDRLAAVYSARTYGELEPALADLPAPATSTTPDGSDERISAVLASEVRGGRWDVPRRLEVFASLGSCKLDLTHAVVRHREVVIDARLYLSSLLVLVPEGIDVRIEPGGAFLGGRTLRTSGRVTEGAPVVRIRGRVALSTLTVRTPGRLATVLRTLLG
jgi:Domain of unknown function (DUF1707)